jgi:PAS domain S-box-containing protein
VSSPYPDGLHPEAAPIVLNAERLDALAASGLMNAHAEDVFDQITTLAAQVASAEVALITLLGQDCSLFKSVHGADMPPGHAVPLSHSLCQHVVGSGAVVVAEDAAAHPAYRDNGAVSDLNVGAYLGVPVRAPSGHVLGSLCAIDFRPRPWSDAEVSGLKTLAGSVERELALRQELIGRERAQAQARAEAESLAAVLSVNAQLAAELDPDRLVQAVIDAGTAITDAAFGAFFYTPGLGEDALLFAVSGAPRSVFERLGPVRMTPVFEPSFSGRATVRASDITADPRYGKMGGMPVDHLPVRSYLSVPVRDPQGAPLGALLFGHPEPDRFDARAEQVAEAIAVQAAIALQNARLHRALDESAHQHRLVLSKLNDVVFQTDASGRFSYLNDAWAAKTGYAVLDSIGRHALAFVAEDREPLKARLLDITRQADAGRNDAFQHSVIVRHAGGHTLHFEAGWRLAFDEDGAHAGWIGALSDVTDTVRYHAEREAREAAETARVEAERAVRLQRAFLANMSHEIRTPLTSVLGSAEILAEEVPDDLRGLASLILSGGVRLLDTLNAVLDLSQIDAGHMTPNPRPADVRTLLQAAMQEARALADEKGLRLEVDVPDIDPLLLDAGLFDRVVANLIGNAVKFTDRGRVSVRASHDAARLVVEVADTGIGIAPEHQENVFDQFRQASEGTNRTHEGNGLGLALARRVARLLGGDIHLTSTVGAGSRFTVSVPAPPAGMGGLAKMGEGDGP